MRRGDPRHGTARGYKAHRKSGQPACRPCLDAWNAYLNGDDGEIALTGGHWVLGPRRVLVWQSWQECAA